MHVNSSNAQNIAYVGIIFDAESMTGVINKMKALAPSFKKNGMQVIIINEKISGEADDIYFLTFDEIFRIPKKIRGLFVRSFKYFYVARAVRTGKFKAAVVRYSFADFSLPFLLSCKDFDVFLEHHTKEPSEILAMRRFRSVKFIQLSLELIIPKLFGHLTKGTIGVSSNITEFAARRFSATKTITIGNRVSGNIIVSDRKILELTTCLNLVMSASRFSDWHGVDRMLDALRLYQGEIKINLHLVGELNQDLKARIDACECLTKIKIFCHGKLPQDKLFEVYNNSHIGIDSLGLKRIGITQGSTLKSKEYMARCLPFIFATPDDAFNDYPAFFVQRGGVDIQEILDWYASLQGKYIRSSKFCMRLSWDSAAAQLAAFVSA